MSCCNTSTAKTGRLILVDIETISPPTSQVTTGDCISDKFTIDCSSIFPGGTGRIEQIDLIEKVGTSESKIQIDTDLFLTSNDFTAQSAGSGFAITLTDSEIEELITMEPLTGYTDIDSTKSYVSKRGLDLNFKSSTSRAIYGQLIASGTGTYTAFSRLILRMFVSKD